jgi:hypothetical protein
MLCGDLLEVPRRVGAEVHIMMPKEVLDGLSRIK